MYVRGDSSSPWETPDPSVFRWRNKCVNTNGKYSLIEKSTEQNIFIEILIKRKIVLEASHLLGKKTCVFEEAKRS